MQKLALFIQGKSKTVVSPTTLHIGPRQKMFVKTATVFWNYDNVFKGYNDTIGYRSGTVLFEPGYWSFAMIAEKIKELGLTALTENEHNHTCTLTSDGAMDLKEFGQLYLGFQKT